MVVGLRRPTSCHSARQAGRAVVRTARLLVGTVAIVPSTSYTHREKQMTRFKSVAFKFGILLSSLVFVAIVFETGLAFARINTKSNVLFIPDKGAIFVPNSYYRNNQEGFSEGYFNSHGFRDYDRSYQKDPQHIQNPGFGRFLCGSASGRSVGCLSCSSRTKTQRKLNLNEI